jgi:type I restriction enzyme S subunit
MELKPGYKQTEVGVIPEDWDVKKLKDVAEIRSGIAKNSKAVVANPVEISYLRVANVQDGYLDLSDISTITLSRDDINRYTVMPGDVLMNEGGDLDKLGRGAIWGGDLSPIVHQNHVFVVRCKKGILPEFLNAWTSGSTSRRYFLVAGKQTTNLASINKSSLGGLPIALPCPSEQQKIAEALNELDSMIQSLNELTAKKRAIKQAAMQELLSGKRRLPGFEGEWEEVSLGSVASMNSGGTPPTGRDDFYGGGIPWVSISDMTSGGKFIAQTERTLSAAGLANCAAKQFPAGTILYAMYASLGECSIATTEITTSQAILGIRPGESLHNEFLYYYLSSIHDKVKLIGQQGTQSNLNKGIVQGFTLRLPDKVEQIAIAEALGDIDQELVALSMKTQKTQEMKAGMMQQLLTGKIRLT